MKIRAPGMVKFLADMAGKSGCWDWPKYKNKDGYGLTKQDGKTTVATRVAYRLAYGSFDDRLYVLHRCDNPACVRPDHLFLGDAAANAADAKSKDRHCRGTRNGNALLTDDMVREIRACAAVEKQTETARRFGIRQSSVWLIQNRRQWTHVN